MYELHRLLLRPRRLLILLMAALVNLALFSGYCRAQKAAIVQSWEQMHAWGIDTHRQEQQQLKQYLEKDYPAYLEYITSQSQSQSILGKLNKQKTSAFIDRNLEKTVQDYTRLGEVHVENGENRGIQSILNYNISDYLMLLAPLLLVLELLADSHTAVGDLTRTTKRGRMPLVALQALAILLYSAASVACIYGGNLLYTCFYYGNPGLTRAIQSLPQFQSCVHPLSIGGYLLSAALLKTAAIAIIALFVWLLLSRCHPVLGWSAAFLVLAEQYLCSRLVLPTARFNHLRFLNLFTVLEADSFFTGYCNLNWFSHPSGFLFDTVLLLCLLGSTLLLLCLWCIGHCYPKKFGARLEALHVAVQKRLNRFLPCHTLFGFEGWKLLIAQKALPVLIITALLGVSLAKDMELYLPYHWERATLYEEFQGEVTSEKITTAAKKIYRTSEKIVIARKQLEIAISVQSKEAEHLQYKLQVMEDELSGYEWALNSMLSLSHYQKDTGRSAWFINVDNYNFLFSETASERRVSMLLLLFLILAFSGLCAYDNQYGTGLLLRSTKNGRLRMRLCQGAWVLLLCMLVSAALHCIVLWKVIQIGGLPLLEAPAQSFPPLRSLPFPMSLRTAIVWYMIVRGLAAFVVACVIGGISRLCRTPQKALLCAAVVFLLPTALAESGITQFESLDIVHFLVCGLH